MYRRLLFPVSFFIRNLRPRNICRLKTSSKHAVRSRLQKYSTPKSLRARKTAGWGSVLPLRCRQSGTAAFTSKLKLIKLNTIRPPLILLLMQLRAIVIAVKLRVQAPALITLRTDPKRCRIFSCTSPLTRLIPCCLTRAIST